MKGDNIAERLVNFSVAVIGLVSSLPKNNSGWHLGKQLVRSATGGGSNYEEARGSESRADFIHKLSIAAKELRETKYWLNVIEKSKLGNHEEVRKLISEAAELTAILTTSIKTAKSGLVKRKLGTSKW